jgi:hypothetical protein
MVNRLRGDSMKISFRKKEGWNWQRFLKLLSYRTGDAILYIEGKITWESFVKKVMEGVYGELGEIIKKG